MSLELITVALGFLKKFSFRKNYIQTLIFQKICKKIKKTYISDIVWSFKN